MAKILVPHDGTEMSDRVFKKAVDFAKAFHADLILLHVIEGIPTPRALVFGGDAILINRAKRSLRRQLEMGWEKLFETKMHEIENDNLRLTGECRYGSAADQICSLQNVLS